EIPKGIATVRLPLKTLMVSRSPVGNACSTAMPPSALGWMSAEIRLVARKLSKMGIVQNLLAKALLLFIEVSLQVDRRHRERPCIRPAKQRGSPREEGKSH